MDTVYSLDFRDIELQLQYHHSVMELCIRHYCE